MESDVVAMALGNILGLLFFFGVYYLDVEFLPGVSLPRTAVCIGIAVGGWAVLSGPPTIQLITRILGAL